MSDIFISYKREEREKARAIAEMLVKHGYDVWWDIELLPGDKFSREIDEVIKNASAAIVLWSKKAVDSNFIRAEAHKANNRNILITARLDECELPIPFNISHTMDLSMWDGSPNSPMLEPLVKAVKKKIGSRSNKVQTKKEIETKIEQPKALGEVEYWKSISEGKAPKIKEYQAYIKKYGANGIFNDLAKLKIEELKVTASEKLPRQSVVKRIIVTACLLMAIVLGVMYFLPMKTPDVRRVIEINRVSICQGVSSNSEIRSKLFEAIKSNNLNSSRDCSSKLNSVNFHNEFGHSPLTSAAFHGDLPIVELLVRRGANVNLTDNDQGQRRTALHYAIKNGHRDVAKFLICKNASKTARDSLGKTPLDYDSSDSYRNVRCE